jgi:hypothetical protein
MYVGAGNVTLNRVTFSFNGVQGGAGGKGGSGYRSYSVGGPGAGGAGGSGYGGGLFVIGGNVTLTNSAFYGNVARGGGGGQGGTNTFQTAGPGGSGGTGQGGGLFIQTTPATLANVTLTANTARGGAGGPGGRTFNGRGGAPGGPGVSSSGGIHSNAAILTFHNVLDAANIADSNPDFNGTVTSSGHDLIGDGTGNSSFSAANGDLVGSAVPIKPLLVPLPGGMIPVLPGAGSLAVDAGLNSLAVDAAGHPLTTDVRGFARIVGASVDIGAYECQMSATPPANQTATEGIAGTFNLGSLADASFLNGPWTVTVNWGDRYAPPPGPATASFVKADTSTQGDWVGAYGADGYYVSQDPNIQAPSYAQVTFNGQSDFTWTPSTGDGRALQKPENPNDRIAGTWYTGTGESYTIDVNLTDGFTHKVALYALDYDSANRGETIKVLDAATGAVLDTQTLAAGSFQNGEYLVWNLKGHVKFEVDHNSSFNAVVSGLFFDTDNSTSTSTTVFTTSSRTIPSQSFTYREEGTYTTAVTVSDRNNDTARATFHVTAGDAGLSALSLAVTQVEGQPLTNVQVARFTDPGSDGTPADYSATVTWDDGNGTSHTSPGTIQLLGGNTFAVYASNTTPTARKGRRMPSPWPSRTWVVPASRPTVTPRWRTRR